VRLTDGQAFSGLGTPKLGRVTDEDMKNLMVESSRHLASLLALRVENSDAYAEGYRPGAPGVLLALREGVTPAADLDPHENQNR
jgi:hypothetical protein